MLIDLAIVAIVSGRLRARDADGSLIDVFLRRYGFSWEAGDCVMNFQKGTASTEWV